MRFSSLRHIFQRRFARRSLLSGAFLLLLLFFAAVASGRSPVRSVASVPTAPRQRVATAYTELAGDFDRAEFPEIDFDANGWVRSLTTRSPAATVLPRRAIQHPDALVSEFLGRHCDLLCGGGSRVAFPLKRSRPSITGNRQYLRFGQSYQGLPVYGAEIIVETDMGGRIGFLLADVMRDTEFLDSGQAPLSPALAPKDAIVAGVAWAGRSFGVENAECMDGPDLVLFAPDVIGGLGAVRPAWRMTIGSPSGAALFCEEIIVDARSGGVLFDQPLAHDALYRRVYDARDTNTDPGTLVRFEGVPAVRIEEADRLYDYLGDVYEFYRDMHGRDSFDNLGAVIEGIVHLPGQNAMWNGATDRLYFSRGLVADDVVAHEFTHGVTFHESFLNYSYQSGAINESFSDMWGEWIDLSNGRGNDSAEVRWLMGEDLASSIGVVRNMKNPPAFGDPDSMGSPLWYNGTADHGGVHTNSGVGNKLAYLLTDGDRFNGRSIEAMGIERTARLFYEVQTNLLPRSGDYEDLYLAAARAAVNLGWSADERGNLSNAFRAVGIRPAALGDFRAFSAADSPHVFLTWKNPNQPGFQRTLIRQSSDYSPPTPDGGGVVIYNGISTVTMVGPLERGRIYHFAAWASYGDGEYGAAARVDVGVGDTPADHYTELFATGTNDLSGRTVTFTPDGSANFYGVASGVAPSLSAAGGGSSLTLRDDSWVEIPLSSGHSVSLYGNTYSSVFVGSNGYITLGSGDSWMVEALPNHFDRPRVSALFDDLNPEDGGSILWKEMDDRIVASWLRIPKWHYGGENSFRIEIFYDGRIRISWFALDATDGLAGLSAGEGTPAGFAESDLTSYVPRLAAAQHVGFENAGHCYAAAWNLTTGDYPWGPAVDTFAPAGLDFYLAGGNWIGLLLYDYEAAAYTETIYLFKP